MFVSKNQFYVFISCVAFGAICGVVYLPFFLIKVFCRNKFFEITVDVAYFLLLSVLFCVYAFLMCFPTLRVYMLVGVFVGILLYFKSFHILLANYMKKFYNIVKKTFLKVGYDRIKVKKNDCCLDRRCGTSFGLSALGYDISTDSDRQTGKGTFRVKRKNRTVYSNDKRRRRHT